MISDILSEKFYSILFFCVGIWVFFHGFMRFRRKRMVENIPTSTVRSIAMGLVELAGTARAITKSGDPFKTPLSGIDCAYFQYAIKVRVRSGKNSHWQTIVKGDSLEYPFWLIDNTGKVPVLPKGAEIMIKRGYRYESWSGAGMPVNLKDFMFTYGLQNHVNRHLLFEESYIKEGGDVYVLGSAKKSVDYLDKQKEDLANRLYELKTNRMKRAAIDLNKDGEISMEEWNIAADKIEQELFKESVEEHKMDSHDVIISKGGAEPIFMISDVSQKDLIWRLSFESVFFIMAGAGVSIFTFWSILDYVRRYY